VASNAVKGHAMVWLIKGRILFEFEIATCLHLSFFNLIK